jgi:hypothetical protein
LIGIFGRKFAMYRWGVFLKQNKGRANLYIPIEDSKPATVFFETLGIFFLVHSGPVDGGTRKRLSVVSKHIDSGWQDGIRKSRISRHRVFVRPVFPENERSMTTIASV